MNSASKVILLCATVMLALSPMANAQLMITAVEYDPQGSDTGKEWVQVFNNAATSLNVTNIVLESGNGAQADDWTQEYVLGGVLSPFQAIIIGESDIELADFTTNLDFQNGPDAVRLRIEDEVLDTVGWGEHEFDDYYESQPTQDVGDGIGLRRKCIYDASWSCQDDDNNQNDFDTVATQPYHFSLYVPQNFELQINAIPPLLENLTVYDAVSSIGGVNWLGKSSSQSIPVSFDMVDVTNSSIDIQITDVTDNIIYSATLPSCICAVNTSVVLPAYINPGDYTITVSSGQSELQQVVDVLVYQAVTTDIQATIDTSNPFNIGVLELQNMLDIPLNLSIGIAATIDQVSSDIIVQNTTLLYGGSVSVALGASESLQRPISVPQNVVADLQEYNLTITTWVDIR